MGAEIIDAVSKDDVLKIVCGIDVEENETNSFPIYNNFNKIKEKIDVIIDFSIPVATFNMLEYAKTNKIPVVIATTGFSKEELNKICEFSKVIPIFRSSNMSLDINLMADIVRRVSKVLSNTDIEIIETHHNRKIDAPSGTAILLADAINEAFEEKKTYNFGRFQNKAKRSKNEIGFSSIRGGNIVGEHTVKFFGDNETFEITHTSYSRQVFAEGAINAAKFIANKPTGLFGMNDLLK